MAVSCSDTHQLDNQDEVDALAALNCQTIGSLETSSPLSNLDGLESIERVDGILIIDTTKVADISGLSGLQSVGGWADISVRNSLGDEVLDNVDALSNLSAVGGNLFINTTANLDGLAGLRTIGGDLTIRDLSIDIDGLSGVNSIGGMIYIEGTTLANLDGLSGITGEVESIIIRLNSQLIDVDGLANISSVRDSIDIYQNDSLLNIDGLANVSGHVATLEITHNDSVIDLDGLVGLSTAGEIHIYYNQSLTSLGLVNLTGVDGEVNIHSNSLADLDGLAALNSVDVISVGEPLLSNIDGLSGLSSASFIGLSDGAFTNIDALSGITSLGGLSIRSNQQLTNLNGLANLTQVINGLAIQYNYRLSDCQGILLLLGWPDESPEQNINGPIDINSNAPGCRSIQEIMSAAATPTQVSITNVTSTNQSAAISFTSAAPTSELFPVTGYRASCTSVTEATDNASVTLSDNVSVSRNLVIAGYDPVSVDSSVEVDIDITHTDPSHLTLTLLSPEGTETKLWDRGATGGQDLTGSFPSTFIPIDPLSAYANEAMDGLWTLTVEDVEVGPLVREGTLNSWGLRITEELSAEKISSPITLSNFVRGRPYRCVVAPLSKLGALPLSDAYEVTVPYTEPSTPVIAYTDYEDGKIILGISVSDNGGREITTYSATCSDGSDSFTSTSASSPITVSGLMNDVAYTCTVTATNSVGTSSASASTAPITPEATATNGLPIWLLYQATQQSQ